MENKRLFAYTFIAGCLICMIAVLFRVFTDMELPARLMAAILGVVITATITQMLLQGQTKKEGTLRRDAKIFEEKLKIYQNFLNILYNAVKDGRLSESERMELQFQTSLVAMHCSPESIIAVSAAVRRVVASTCPQAQDGSVGDTDLLKSLFAVVEAFRKDLYDSDAALFDDATKDKTIENFSKAFGEACAGNEEEETDEPKPQRISVDLNVVSPIPVSTAAQQNGNERPVASIAENGDEPKAADTSLWEKAVADWRKDGWNTEGLDGSDNNTLTIKPADKSNPGYIDMGFYDNHYYIEATYGDDTDFAKPLKWDNGGRRMRGSWWEYLPGKFYEIPEGKLHDTFKSSPMLQQHIIERVNYLEGIIQKHHRTTVWKNAVGEHSGWHLFVWYWNCLACERQSEEEGKVYFDIIPKADDAGKTVFKLGNRSKDVELLKQTLVRIGSQDRIKDINAENCTVDFCTTSFDVEEVAAAAKELIRKLSA